MADVTTFWNVQGASGDWALIPGDLQGGDDLETATLISLFTDRLALASDTIPDGTTDRRGWWADLGQDYPIGSRLWLLARAKQVPQTLLDAQNYCTEALQWMIADGVAAKVAVAASFIGLGQLGIVATLYDQAGGVIASYQWAWKGCLADALQPPHAQPDPSADQGGPRDVRCRAAPSLLQPRDRRRRIGRGGQRPIRLSRLDRAHGGPLHGDWRVSGSLGGAEGRHPQAGGGGRRDGLQYGAVHGGGAVAYPGWTSVIRQVDGFAYVTTASGAIPAGQTTVAVPIEATTTGSAGDCEAGTVMVLGSASPVSPASAAWR